MDDYKYIWEESQSPGDKYMDIMDILDDNIVVYILNFVNDKSKVQFLSTSRKIRNLLMWKIKYTKIYEYGKIKKLPYYNQFNYIKYLANDINIPEGITHLEFGDFFNQPIEKCIPDNIINLTFGWEFNQPIKGCIPSQLTHLTFGCRFNQSIKECIPNTVTHLIFGYAFDQSIEECIPNSVTHLKFGWKFNQPIKEFIPNSVTHLTLQKYFYKKIKEDIPKNISIETYLYFD
uniref:F-box and FNIp repeat-containing protein n=1 Tax=Borely moumouvirus TaxID=2712067 RepID=A0A6G6ADS9_9VIRU